METTSEIKGHNSVNNEWILSLIKLDLHFMIINLCMKYNSNVFKRIQGSHRNEKTQFNDFSIIFHDQQCNFHDYLMHDLQPPLLAASSHTKH